MMTKRRELAEVYLAIQLLFAEKPKAGWRVFESVKLLTATNDFK